MPNIDLVAVLKIVILVAIATTVLIAAGALVGELASLGTGAADVLKQPGETTAFLETDMSPWGVMAAALGAATGDVDGSSDLLQVIGAVMAGVVVVIVGIYAFKFAAKFLGGS